MKFYLNSKECHKQIGEREKVERWRVSTDQDKYWRTIKIANGSKRRKSHRNWWRSTSLAKETTRYWYGRFKKFFQQFYVILGLARPKTANIV